MTPIAFEIMKHQREEMLLVERNRIDWEQMQIAVLRATGQWPNGKVEGAAYGVACFLWWLLCGRRLDDAWEWKA